MPRPGFPPTPAASTDITGKDNASFTAENTTFILPPAAFGRRSSSSGSLNIENPHAPPSPTSPMQMPLPQKKINTTGQQDIDLPPPPTRSRKIIQMKPGSSSKKAEQQPDDITAATADTAKTSPAGPSGKRKQGPTTSAGRKIARKTAHSIIERRRRSKMNEEFGVLKDMIPACSGQEMHKLAILQASIEYLRYLEQCVSELKAGRKQQEQMPMSRASSDETSLSEQNTPAADLSPEDPDSDEEMEDNDNEASEPSPQEQQNDLYRFQSITTLASTVSPAFSASSYHSHRFPNIELPSPHDVLGYSFMGQRPGSKHSASPYTYAATPISLSTTTSPMILPQGTSEVDHEASAALLMLNATDRRLAKPALASTMSVDSAMSSRPTTSGTGTRSSSGMRGMSVQDLLRS